MFIGMFFDLHLTSGTRNFRAEKGVEWEVREGWERHIELIKRGTRWGLCFIKK